MVANREWTVVEIGETLDLTCLADEVRQDERPRLLRRNGEDVAVLIPVADAKNLGFRGPHTEADATAFRSAAGSWKEVDTDRLLDEIYADRGRPIEPTVKT